jgi:hypothetical protein
MKINLTKELAEEILEVFELAMDHDSMPTYNEFPEVCVLVAQCKILYPKETP